MGLHNIRSFLNGRGMKYNYFEEDGCASIDFIHNGLSYHIWEFPQEERGAESNVRTTGKMEVFNGDYEQQILTIMNREF